MALEAPIHVHGEEIPVDRSIAPLLQRLNDAGFPTLFSCSGMRCDHPNKSGSAIPYIAFNLGAISKSETDLMTCLDHAREEVNPTPNGVVHQLGKGELQGNRVCTRYVIHDVNHAFELTNELIHKTQLCSGQDPAPRVTLGKYNGTPYLKICAGNLTPDQQREIQCFQRQATRIDPASIEVAPSVKSEYHISVYFHTGEPNRARMLTDFTDRVIKACHPVSEIF
jgi:hypothetical protein